MKPVSGEKFRLVDDDLLIPVTGKSDEEEGTQLTQEDGAVSQETQAESTNDEGKSTEDFTSKYDELRSKYEADVGKVKSVLQQRETELVKEKTVLEKKLNELLKSTMDGEDRKQFEYEQLQEELTSIRDERDTLKEQNEQTKLFYTWVEYFTDAGIPKSELVMDDGMSGLFASGMTAMQKQIKSLKEGTKSATVQKQGKEVPEVAQSAKGKLSSIVSLSDAIKHFANGDAEEFWRMAEMQNPKVLQVLNELNSK